MAVYFIVALIGGMLCAGLAVSNDRNPAGWFVIGFLLPLIGVILVLVLPNEKQVEERIRAVLAAERRPPAAARVVTPGPPQSPPEDRAATDLLAAAQRHHFAKEFGEARRVYGELIERYPDAKEAAVARQQLGNLKAL